MSDIRVNELETLAPSAINGDYYGIVFTADGDTNKVVFEDAVAQSFENAGNVVLKIEVIIIPSADVLTGNATPINLNITRASGQTIVPIYITAAIISSTTPYATNTTIAVRYVGADTDIFTSDMLARTDSNAVVMQPNYTVGAAQTQLLSDTDLEVYVKTGNPTAGDGVLVLGVTYNVS